MSAGWNGWTPELVDDLRARHERGERNCDIAIALGCTQGAVASKLARLRAGGGSRPVGQPAALMDPYRADRVLRRFSWEESARRADMHKNVRQKLSRPQFDGVAS